MSADVSRTAADPPVAVQVRDGAVRPVPDPAEAVRDGADLVWLELTDPTVREVGEAVRVLGLPPGLVAQARADAPPELDPDEPTRRRRARLVQDAGGRGLVLLSATYDEQDPDVRLGLLTVLVSDRAALVLRRGEAPDLAPVRARLADAGDPTARALEGVLELVLRAYDDVLDALDGDVEDVEQAVFSTERVSHAQRIYVLKRETLQLQRAVLPLDEVATRLDCPQTLREHVMRVSEHVDRLDNLLDGVLDADLAQVGVRQNEDQRRISAWAAIALVPTVVAGIYGMNFQHMPELGWRYGYPGAIALILVVCAALHSTFRRNGWLS